MNLAKAKTLLEVATNVAVLLVAAVFLGNFAWNYAHRKPAQQLRLGLEKGKSFAPLDGVDYSHAPQTLLIAMNTTCGYCKESIPFYQQLVSNRAEQNKTTKLIAIFSERQNVVQQYLEENQLEIESISSADFKALNLAGTPTLVLLDNSGKVIDFWVGKLPKEAEPQVRQALDL
jgi:thiol-disulfide isomerase/thioredoxin